MTRIFPRVHYRSVEAGIPAVKEAIQKADIIMNATPLGLKKGDPLVIPQDWVPKASEGKKLFMDLIYNPAVTPFLKIAKKKGHKVLNGLGMLLYQGALAFEYWTGRKAPVMLMRQALLEAIKEKGK